MPHEGDGGSGVSPELIDTLWQKAIELQAGMVDFARRLVHLPSLPGQEGEVAALVAQEMRRLEVR